MGNNRVFLTVNASGAVKAARAKNVVLIVDLIDMSTSLEAALDAGASHVFGASPDQAGAPVKLGPAAIGRQAGTIANREGTGVIIICEPRVGTEEERRARCSKVIEGIEQAGAGIEAIFPNLGAETPKLGDFNGRVVVAVSGAGGIAYDAAFTAGAPAVLTGTVARTMRKKGPESAREAARRAIKAAVQAKADITVVAASANAVEDILAAEYIMRMIIEAGFTAITH